MEELINSLTEVEEKFKKGIYSQTKYYYILFELNKTLDKLKMNNLESKAQYYE